MVRLTKVKQNQINVYRQNRIPMVSIKKRKKEPPKHTEKRNEWKAKTHLPSTHQYNVQMRRIDVAKYFWQCKMNSFHSRRISNWETKFLHTIDKSHGYRSTFNCKNKYQHLTKIYTRDKMISFHFPILHSNNSPNNSQSLANQHSKFDNGNVFAK